MINEDGAYNDASHAQETKDAVWTEKATHIFIDTLRIVKRSHPEEMSGVNGFKTAGWKRIVAFLNFSKAERTNKSSPNYRKSAQFLQEVQLEEISTRQVQSKLTQALNF